MNLRKKILVISANYPPFHSGGYELRVKNILDGLAERGHSIRVLTNKPERLAGKRAETSSYPVLRMLHNRYKTPFFPSEIMLDLQDTALLEKQIAEFQPDIIYIGHLYILSKALLPYLARLEIPIVYDEGGSGLIDTWIDHGRWFRFSGDWHSRIAPFNLIKPVIIRLVCQISKGRITPTWYWPANMHIFFNSELSRKVTGSKGVDIYNSVVIHSGIDMEKFTFKPRIRLADPVKILIPGRIEPRKGQMDVIALFRLLADEGTDTQIIIVGDNKNGNFLNMLRNAIHTVNANEKIMILPMLSQNELVQYYHQSDICFFPSMQRFGFSRTPLEAMACGCVVISYGNEGSDEIIQHFQNGFLVEPGNMQGIAQILQNLAENPQTVKEITESARKEIEKNYSFASYLDQVEKEINQRMTQF